MEDKNEEKNERVGLYDRFKKKFEENKMKSLEVENINIEQDKKSDEVEIYETDDEKIQCLNIELLDEFKTHIFSKLPDSKFEELKDSIKRNGVISPIIVRKKDDRYEIISGHNRVNCCRELGIVEVPCIIKSYNNDEAELAMIETNLSQREEIPLCEKGLAYKKELELLKKITKSEEQKSIDKLAAMSDESRTSIQRLIKLTNLIPELQLKVNNKELNFISGVEISCISKEEQKEITEYLNKGNKISNLDAQKLKEYNGVLTEEKIKEILKGKIKLKKFTGKIDKEVTKKYKDNFKNDEEFSQLISKLLEEYFNKIQKN